MEFYMEKMETYKKQLWKFSSHAEERDISYKGACRYLKIQADKDIKNDFNMEN